MRGSGIRSAVGATLYSAIMKTTKYRNYAFIVYPESMCDDFFERLEALKLPAFVSPLHDSDTKDDGSLKKPHYHVVLRYSSQVSISHATKDLASLGVSQPPEIVKSLRAYSRYLCHLDQPNKAQYRIDDVRQYMCSDYKDVCKLTTSSDVMAQMDAIEDIIDDLDIISYRALSLIIRQQYPELRLALRTHPSHYVAYVKSAAYDCRTSSKE